MKQRAKEWSVLAMAICGIAVAAATPAAAAGSSDLSLSADKGVVRPGSTVTLRLSHGIQAISWISSPAFVVAGAHPAGASEGMARVITDRDGSARAVATIGNVAPGSYPVHTRVGGGSGPTMNILVAG